MEFFSDEGQENNGVSKKGAADSGSGSGRPPCPLRPIDQSIFWEGCVFSPFSWCAMSGREGVRKMVASTLGGRGGGLGGWGARVVSPKIIVFHLSATILLFFLSEGLLVELWPRPRTTQIVRGLRSAIRSQNAAYWPSRADSLPRIRERRTDIADLVGVKIPRGQQSSGRSDVQGTTSGCGVRCQRSAAM